MHYDVFRWVSYAENVFLFLNKRLLKKDIFVQQKISNKFIIHQKRQHAIKLIEFNVIPVGHEPGIHWLKQSLHAINLLQHVAKITGGFITSKQTIHWNASLTFVANEVGLNTSFKVS